MAQNGGHSPRKLRQTTDTFCLCGYILLKSLQRLWCCHVFDAIFVNIDTIDYNWVI